MQIDDALSLIREIPDYPIAGVRFQDVTPLLAHGEAFAVVTSQLARYAAGGSVIAGVEARGFIFASAVAHQLATGFIPIRKAGKLPHSVFSESYGLEYGKDTLEIHTDALIDGAEVLLIDDVLATGGTICAAIELIKRGGGKVTNVITVIEIAELAGRQLISEKYSEIKVSSLVVA